MGVFGRASAYCTTRRVVGVLAAALVVLALSPAAALAAGAISGTVSTGSSTPLQGATVELLLEKGGEYENTGASRSTNSSGGYEFEGLSGTYKILVRSPLGENYASWFYSNTGGAPYIEGATAIVVSSSNVKGVDVNLPVGGQITGQLIDAVSGAPVAGAVVEALSSGGAIAAQQLNSGPDGSYTLNRLEGGTYSVYVNGEAVKGGAYQTYTTGPPLGGTRCDSSLQRADASAGRRER